MDPATMDCPFCPACNLRMTVARIEPRPNDEGHCEDFIVFRCQCGEELEKQSLGAHK